MDNVFGIVGELLTLAIIVVLIVSLSKAYRHIEHLREQVRTLDGHIDETWDTIDVLEFQDNALAQNISAVVIEVAALKDAKPSRKPAVRKTATTKTTAKKEAK